jgi:hypothetical protein
MKRRLPDNSRLLRSFPELALFTDREDREAAWAAATHEAGGLHIFAFFLLLIGSGGLLLELANVHAVPPLLSLCGVLGPGALLFSTLNIREARIQRSLRRQLSDRGHLLCGKCGYDLKGQTTPRCPECGTPFDRKLLEHANPAAAGGKS